MRDSRRKRATTAASVAWKRRQLLERDVAVEVGLAREVDDGHAAAPDLPDDLEPSDLTRGLRHGKPLFRRK